jgi:hypothetical protein
LFVDDDVRSLVALKLLRPDIIDVGADDIDETTSLILRRADLTLLLLGADAAELAGELSRGRRIDAEDQIADNGQNADAQAAARDGSAS